MTELDTQDNLVHTGIFNVEYGETYKLFFMCDGISEFHTISEPQPSNEFHIKENRCNNYYEWTLCGGGVDCAEGAEHNDSLDEGNQKCCSVCEVCGVLPQCNATEECKNNAWDPNSELGDRCCLNECGNCNTDDFPICVEGQICTGQEVIFGGETCCDGQCLDCDDLTGEICEDDKICENDDYDPHLTSCCLSRCQNCSEAGGETCELDEICNGDWLNEDFKCCDGDCQNCTEAGGESCEFPNQCNDWFDESLNCCKQNKCGSCHDENHFICEEGITTCNVTKVTWGDESCCPQKCENCTELGGLICEDDEICMNWLNQDIICCEENECKNCTELGGVECTEICTGYESVELDCCKVDNCGDCEFHGGNICEAHETCDGNWAGGPEDKCCIGECNDEPQLIIVFAPLNWQGSRESFELAAQQHFDTAINNLPLKDCSERAQLILAENCEIPLHYCIGSCPMLGQGKTCVEGQGITDYDNIVLLAEYPSSTTSECGPGFTCLGGVAYSSTYNNYVSIHELGHEWGLNDEYVDACHCGYGLVDANANCLQEEFDGFDIAYPNRICEKNCQHGYTIYCLGNKNVLGGRDIMSYAGAPSPSAFAQPSWDHLLTVPIVNCG